MMNKTDLKDWSKFNDIMAEEQTNRAEKISGVKATGEYQRALQMQSKQHAMKTVYNIESQNAQNQRHFAQTLEEQKSNVVDIAYADALSRAGMLGQNVGAYPVRDAVTLDGMENARNQLFMSNSKKPSQQPIQTHQRKPDGFVGKPKGKHVKMAPPQTTRPRYLHRNPRDLSVLAQFDDDRIAYQREMAFRKPMPKQRAESPPRMTPL